MKTDVCSGDPRSLTLLEVNARFLPHETFQALVRNIKRDGHLTSVPLVYRHEGRADYDELPAGTLEVLSGNHRTKAAIEAGLSEIRWLEITEPMTRQQRIAVALSHNAIAGQDDPATLKRLYDEIADVDWRDYAGLDDKTLELLEKVDVESLSEANLDFSTVQIVFLPHERDAAERALKDAMAAVTADARWLVPFTLYQPTLDALASAHGAYGVGNVATAFGILLAVLEQHLDELREGWYDPQECLPTRDGFVPVETAVGARELPAEAAAVIAQAVDRLVARGDVDAKSRWRALELMAAEVLASA